MEVPPPSWVKQRERHIPSGHGLSLKLGFWRQFSMQQQNYAAVFNKRGSEGTCKISRQSDEQAMRANYLKFDMSKERALLYLQSFPGLNIGLNLFCVSFKISCY